jgi:hypothetical protein
MTLFRKSQQQARLWSLILRSVLLGAFMGSANSVMVNCALIEISLSPFFALAFGFLFLVSGAAVGWQATQEPDDGQTNRALLFCFAVITTTSGIVAFLLERDWSHGLSAQAKVPLYGLLGVSLAFSINFSVFELAGKLQQCLCENATPLVRTEWQVLFRYCHSQNCFSATQGDLPDDSKNRFPATQGALPDD